MCFFCLLEALERCFLNLYPSQKGRIHHSPRTLRTPTSWASDDLWRRGRTKSAAGDTSTPPCTPSSSISIANTNAHNSSLRLPRQHWSGPLESLPPLSACRSWLFGETSQRPFLNLLSLNFAKIYTYLSIPRRNNQSYI